MDRAQKLVRYVSRTGVLLGAMAARSASWDRILLMARRHNTARDALVNLCGAALSGTNPT